MAGPGPTNVASISLASTDSIAVGPELNAVQRIGAPMAFSYEPVARAYNAWAWVTFGKNPNRKGGVAAPKDGQIHPTRAIKVKTITINARLSDFIHLYPYQNSRIYFILDTMQAKADHQVGQSQNESEKKD